MASSFFDKVIAIKKVLFPGIKQTLENVDERVLPVTEKERRGEGESSIGPRMKYPDPVKVGHLRTFLCVWHQVAFILSIQSAQSWI